jgi:hypothetical protein
VIAGASAPLTENLSRETRCLESADDVIRPCDVLPLGFARRMCQGNAVGSGKDDTLPRPEDGADARLQVKYPPFLARVMAYAP